MNKCCQCDKVASIKHQFKPRKAKNYSTIWYCQNCYKLKYAITDMKICCKCNGHADVSQEFKLNDKLRDIWYCYDCYRIKFSTTDKVKKYRPWYTWNLTPINDKPFG